MWDGARPINEYFSEHKGESLTKLWKELTFVDLKMAAYGDWRLYRAKDGKLYEEYMSIGD